MTPTQTSSFKLKSLGRAKNTELNDCSPSRRKTECKMYGCRSI
jgi:hypothetical protein